MTTWTLIPDCFNYLMLGKGMREDSICLSISVCVRLRW